MDRADGDRGTGDGDEDGETHVSEKLYPREAASFLPTEDLPVPIMPTRKTLEPSRRSATSAAVSRWRDTRGAATDGGGGEPAKLTRADRQTARAGAAAGARTA